MRHNARLCIGLLGLLLASCGADEAGSATVPPDETLMDGSTAPTSAPHVLSATTPAQVTTAAPATTTTEAGPPVYSGSILGDRLDLDSFVLTSQVDNTNNGQLSETDFSVGYSKMQTSLYRIGTFSYDGGSGATRDYWLNGRVYSENNFGDWYLYEAGGPAAPKYADIPELYSNVLGGAANAQFVAAEDYQGIPAYHYTFNETNGAYYSSYTPENPSPTIEGDFYLSQEGNYVLYAHSKESSPGHVYEITETLSSVGLVPEITLPDDMQPMSQALDVGAGLASLLPPGSALSGLIRYKNGIGVDYFKYTTPAKSNDEVNNFLRALPLTNGWAVTYIGHIRPHLETTNCETKVDCAILQNGGDQIVVSFKGTIIIEYDHDHIFTPV